MRATAQQTTSLLDVDPDAILKQLQEITKSQHFRNSKRCQALLAFSVRNTLAGEKENLRERHVGVELFGRQPTYDTNNDPIVRVAAVEVRKRLAQYYQDEGRDATIHIDLPPGSYVANFHSSAPVLVQLKEEDKPLVAAELPGELAPSPMTTVAEGSTSTARRFSVRAAGIAAVLVLATAAAAAIHLQESRNSERDFWAGFVSGATEIPVVIGQLREPSDAALSTDTLRTAVHRNLRLLPFGDAAAAITICNTMASLSRHCSLKPSRTTDITEIRTNPAIFIGAYNNPWAVRVTSPLPFRFADEPKREIVDSKTSEVIGSVDFNSPASTITTDYAIIARYHSDVTDSQIVVIAGIGPMSTESAAEYITSPEDLAQLKAAAPDTWHGQNLEAVIATDVVDGRPGHVRLVATRFW